MNNKLPEQVQQENILKIKALRVCKIAQENEYSFSVCAQCRGDSSFEWLVHCCTNTEQAIALFSRLVQLHIWSTPEDLELLHNWRSRLNEWLNAPDSPLELEEQSIQPFLLDMIVMRPV